MPEKMYVLYDARAINLSTDNAVVLQTAESDEEARAIGSEGGIWAEYDIAQDGHTLINERMRPDLCDKDSQDSAEKKIVRP